MTKQFFDFAMQVSVAYSFKEYVRRSKVGLEKNVASCRLADYFQDFFACEH